MIAGITASTRRGGSGEQWPYEPIRLSLANPAPPGGEALSIERYDTGYMDREGLVRVVSLDEDMTVLRVTLFSEPSLEISLMEGTRHLEVYEEFTEVNDHIITFSDYIGAPIQAVMDWGTYPYVSMAFPRCASLVVVPDFIPEAFIALDGMFWRCTQFDHQGVEFWNTSNIQSMFGVFQGATSFNANIGSWDTSNVIYQDIFGNSGMESFLDGAENFNQDLSGWCVSQYPEEPFQFSSGATSWTLPKPVWGTCPSTDLPSVIGQAFGGGYYIGDLEIPDADVPGVYAIIMGGLESQAQLAWKTSKTSTAGTSSPTDGLANSKAMAVDGLASHHAASHCLGWGGGGYDDWYFPAKDELAQAWVNRTQLPAVAMEPQYHWSSTQGPEDALAWCQEFEYGGQPRHNKDVGYRVRPTRRILRTAL